MCKAIINHINGLIAKIAKFNGTTVDKLSFKIETKEITDGLNTRKDILLRYDGLVYDFFSWNGEMNGRYADKLGELAAKHGYEIEHQDACSLLVYKWN